MFRKNSSTSTPATPAASYKKDSVPTLITRDLNILGNIISEGAVDFDGTINGNIHCNVLTLRAHGCVNGEVVAETVFIYGKVKGLIRARNVHLYARCNVEGIIMHEALSIEDGAFVDGKFKRTDRLNMSDESDYESDSSSGGTKILDNIRLIAG